MEDIKLVTDKNKCCGCGACANICPKKAIKLVEDEFGFKYPNINKELCIKCGLCKRTCNYQKNTELKNVRETYIATLNNKELIKNSASGGIFAAIAKSVLEKNGIVVGCAWVKEDNRLKAQHIGITSEKELYKLQGSKYVQSDTNEIYKYVKKYLDLNKIVLFSGTPCQVDGLYGFLNGKEYPNLYTIDIICHGTPSAAFFNDYLKIINKKLKGRIIDFKFRDKTDSWGLKGKVWYENHRNKIKYKKMPVQLSSYYNLFLNAEIYRENCYSCKYATDKRIGNITIGDYWGIEKVHPECLVENGGEFDTRYGISCLLVNDENGEKLIKEFGNELILKKSSIEKAAMQNEQLKRPCNIGKNRKKIMTIYVKDGYDGIEKWYYKQLGIKKYIYTAWNHLPRKIQVVLKKYVIKL